MRAYVGCIDPHGLRRFLPEDAVPRDLLQQLVGEWSSRTSTVVLAIVAEDDAETIRQELVTDRRRTACDLLKTWPSSSFRSPAPRPTSPAESPPEAVSRGHEKMGPGRQAAA